MRTESDKSPPIETLAVSQYQLFPPLQSVTKPSLTTEESAYYLNRKPQTLRIWAMKENGLIRPLRINGRLAWPVREIKKVLGMEVTP